ncbi:hypothetical protein IFO70_27415 [Phormidium tenue FACHB-886]|nr:hypothetical protein [Phormidium tenue FACHB-886]
MKGKLVVSSVALASVSVNLTAQSASADELECYMQVDGRTIDLSALCGGTLSNGMALSRPTITLLAVAPPETIRQESRADRWQRAAVDVAALKPYWSGHCRRGNLPCGTSKPTSDTAYNRPQLYQIYR